MNNVNYSNRSSRNHTKRVGTCGSPTVHMHDYGRGEGEGEDICRELTLKNL